MDHEARQKGSSNLNGQYKFDDDFNVIAAPVHTSPTAIRFTTYESSDQVQFQFNPSNNNTISNSDNDYGQGRESCRVQYQRRKLSSKVCNPVVILSVVSLTAVAGALFSTFYLIHSLKPANSFIENVNGMIKSKEMQEVDSTMNSFLKNATNWVKNNIGGKKGSNQTEEAGETKKKSGELVLFGEGNGFSLNSLANLAGQIIKSVNHTISNIANNRTNLAKSKEGGPNEQSLIEKSAQESSASNSRQVPDDEQLNSGQKIYHMS